MNEITVGWQLKLQNPRCTCSRILWAMCLIITNLSRDLCGQHAAWCCSSLGNWVNPTSLRSNVLYTNFPPPPPASTCTDNSVATDGNDDTASVHSWADRCGKCSTRGWNAAQYSTDSAIVSAYILSFLSCMVSYRHLRFLRFFFFAFRCWQQSIFFYYSIFFFTSTQTFSCSKHSCKNNFSCRPSFSRLNVYMQNVSFIAEQFEVTKSFPFWCLISG